jgi:serine/threonine-protein kinase HipA
VTSSSSDSLVVVLYGKRIGRLDREPGGQASFTYDPEYLLRTIRPQLSMRLPLREAPFPPAHTLPFLDGLLPENREARREKARARGISDDPVSLLSVMGWDCPGAVQITPEDQMELMMSREGGLEPVTAAQIGARIARLQDHPAGWTLPEEHWSLAGQQAKFALARQVRDDGSFGWAEAFGSAPTTHILKPGIGRLHHQALVEHATMRAADALGVSVAETEYVEFEGQPAIVVKRFDRVQLKSGVVRRIHQEDFAQATGRLPESKYEADGGPTARDMAQVLRMHARTPEPELTQLADFVLVNYVAAAPDGHAKNLSIRILPDGDVRMAPLYDLASGLPYDKATVDRRLALAIGGERRVDRIHEPQWSRAARELGAPEALLRDRARQLLTDFPDAFHDALVKVGTPEALNVWAHSNRSLAEHTAACLKQLDKPLNQARSAHGRLA